MSDFLLIPLAIVYMIVVSLLFVYGINFLYLTILSIRTGTTAIPPPPDEWPYVTVQLPIFNERYVARRLIRAAAGLDYPRDRIEIQILDDSLDDTREIIAATVAELRLAGIDIVHLHRSDRQGFKAGALAAGLTAARGEFLAIFDADFIPTRDFLKRTVPEFADPGVAFVQTRWGHLNRDYSLLTLLQSIAIDAHFMVEQFARFKSGYWFNFNGTAGIWRKTAIEASGGWKAVTLTEDLDLSYRAFLSGWRGVYLRDVEVRAELPVTFSAYRRQQRRWAQGSLECALALVPKIWSQPISLAKKLEASLHLTGYGIHLLLILLALLYPALVVVSTRYPGLSSLFGVAFLFNLTAFAPTIFFVAAQQQLDERWWKKIPAILFITALGMGMMINTAKAARNILTRKTAVFERTPKFGIASRQDGWRKKAYQLELDPIVFFELGFAIYNMGTIVFALSTGTWIIAVHAAIFTTGLLFAALTTVAQSLGVRIANTDGAPAGD
ncbi:MAG TPA: glycosyltransferase [Anaerolineales bacterium]|nr:glycosyltransferase [Anaerolineales bacterium]